VSGRDAAHKIRHFLLWWRTELVGIMPAAVKRRLEGSRGRWIVALDRNAARILRQANGQETVVSRVDLGASLPADRPHLPRGTRFGGFRRAHRMRLRLDAGEALRTQVSLPQAAEENLAEVLGFELDRLTPFKPRDVFFSHRVESRESATASIKVALTILRRGTVDKALASMSRLGIEVDGVEVAGQAPGEHPELLFRQADDRPTGAAGWALRAAMAMAVAVAIATIGVNLREQDQRIDALRRQVEDGKRVVDESQRLKTQISALEEEQKSFSARNGGQPSVNEVLLQLTRVLPDDTWLDRLRLSGDKVVLSCLSGSSSAVIQLLEGSSLFRNPTLSSQVVHDSAKGRDQFELTASIGGSGK
jgi:general secretion pathway protein L